LLIDQQGESFEETQVVDRSILLLRLQTLDHALLPHGQQFFHQRLGRSSLTINWIYSSSSRTALT
jgi:hypothetical protein